LVERTGIITELKLTQRNIAVGGIKVVTSKNYNYQSLATPYTLSQKYT